MQWNHNQCEYLDEFCTCVETLQQIVCECRNRRRAQINLLYQNQEANGGLLKFIYYLCVSTFLRNDLTHALLRHPINFLCHVTVFDCQLWRRSHWLHGASDRTRIFFFKSAKSIWVTFPKTGQLGLTGFCCCCCFVFVCFLLLFWGDKLL